MSHSLTKAGIGILLILFSLLALTVHVSAKDTPDSAPVSVTELATTTTEEASVVTLVETSTDPRAEIINSYSPVSSDPGCNELDLFLEDLMAEVVSEDMTTYQQVKACYDYIVDNTRYGSHMQYASTMIGDVSCRQIIRNYGTIEGYGAITLKSKIGYCNAYASAFILMVEKVGLDARLVKGTTRGAGGYQVQHQWAEIDIDGVTYLFDPQLEQNLTSAGLGTYNVFCKTYDQVPGRYVRY